MEKNEFLTKANEAGPGYVPSVNDPESIEGTSEVLRTGSQQLKRKLRSKEVQMYCMGTCIGTSLFLQMGSVLPNGGPAGLLIGFGIWGGVMWCVNECFAEMVCYLPIPSPFITLSGLWVDDALGFAMSWNFFIKEALVVPYEIVALNLLLHYWTDAIPTAAVIVFIGVCYAFLHLINVRLFGITEMCMSTFKIALMIGLLLFTFITMLGGNPLHDRFGFRYWKDPGPFVEYKTGGGGGKFLGILSGLLQAAFSYTGPEYISMIASEAELPRTVMPKAYKQVIWRFIVFFIGSALAIGIVVASNDKILVGIYSGKISGSGTTAASPYVIAMLNLKIKVLPSIINACIVTSVFSAGNGTVYAVSRTLYGMSVNHKAPSLFSKTLKNGIPVYAVMVGLTVCCLAFLDVTTSSAKVISWLVSLVTASQLINYAATAVTYRHFYAALQAQGIDRDTLPYKGRFQPYTSYVAMGFCLFGMLANGWTNFVHDSIPFSVRTFFLSYTMIGFFPLAFIFWKIYKKTTYVRPGTADLSLGGIKEEIDAYESSYVPKGQSSVSAWIDRKVF